MSIKEDGISSLETITPSILRSEWEKREICSYTGRTSRNSEINYIGIENSSVLYRAIEKRQEKEASQSVFYPDGCEKSFRSI